MGIFHAWPLLHADQLTLQPGAPGKASGYLLLKLHLSRPGQDFKDALFAQVFICKFLQACGQTSHQQVDNQSEFGIPVQACGLAALLLHQRRISLDNCRSDCPPQKQSAHLSMMKAGRPPNFTRFVGIYIHGCRRWFLPWAGYAAGRQTSKPPTGSGQRILKDAPASCPAKSAGASRPNAQTSFLLAGSFCRLLQQLKLSILCIYCLHSHWEARNWATWKQHPH